MDYTFKVQDGDKEITLKARKPNVQEQKEAERVYRKTIKTALDNGDFLRITLDEKLRAQGLWDDNKQAKYNLLVSEIVAAELQIAKSHMKLSEAKELAIQNIKRRRDLVKLLSTRNSFDEITAEAQAENEKFRYLTSVCTVYNDTGKPYFKSLEDFLSKQDTITAILASNMLMRLLMNYDENSEKNLTEYKFLKKWGFVNEDLRLINKDKKLVDENGKLIDEDGNYIDADGNRVDVNGNPVDADGNWKVDEETFFDDDGNPISPPVEELAEEKLPVIEESVAVKE